MDKTRELVIETFEKSDSEVKDGMDISLLRIKYGVSGSKTEIQWSGANNSLWYVLNSVGSSEVENKELIEVKADKQPIGKTDTPIPFTAHTLELQKGDTLYLMTDGYADQFGGIKGKKFKYRQLEEKLLANSNQTLEEQKNILTRSFEEWKSGFEQVDDVTIIGIRL